MTGLARAVLMVCSVDQEIESVMNDFCRRLGRYVSQHAVALEYHARQRDVARWLATGDFTFVSTWVDGTKSPGPGHRVGAKKATSSWTFARVLSLSD